MALESDRKSFLYLKAAFLAAEPASCLISLARHACGGTLGEEVQNFILEICIENFTDISCNHTYIKNILKKVIVAAESTSDIMVQGLYEQFANKAILQDSTRKESTRIFKKISFLFPCGSDDQSSPKNLLVPLHCSSNILEGDTGCALWPSSLFLTEFILSYPKLFSSKVCYEVGSGVGLVGIALAHVGASKVILTDGNWSSLENMKSNLELNHLTTDKILCHYLQWEYASESELSKYKHDFVLGADIIYDPNCVPHLIRVLCLLLRCKKHNVCEAAASHMSDCRKAQDGDNYNGTQMLAEETEAPVAYIAAVIRNKQTFNHFLLLAEEARLSVMDITEKWKPMNLLSYMQSYDRASVRLCRISYICN